MKKFLEELPTGFIVTVVAGIIVTVLISFIMFIAIKSIGAENTKSRPKYSTTDFLEAVQRMHPMANKICKVIDNHSNSRSAFLIHYPDGVDEHWSGWFWVDRIEFNDFGNHKISAEQLTNIDLYKQVFPDVVGLPCVEKL